MTTIGEYRISTQNNLKQLFGEEAPPLCDILMCHFMNVDKSELILKSDEELPEELIFKMNDAVNKLGYGVPVQYIIGSCWFFGRKIRVGSGCFIPRSDTETLVQAAIPCIPRNGTFADLCSGSGCIAAAIAATRRDVSGFALELSYKALPYTELNTKEFSNIEAVRFDALDEDDYNALRERVPGGIDVIVCNPPYIRESDIDLLQQQIQYEPRTALDGGEDGLRYYRAVTELAGLILKPEGTLLYELGYGQAGDVGAIMASFGYKTATVKDLNGIERVILGKKY